MEIRKQKIMTTNVALHPRSNVDRLYLNRYEGGRGLFSMEECVLAETKSLSEYIKMKEEPMLNEVKRESIFSEEETKEEHLKRIHDHRIKGFP